MKGGATSTAVPVFVHASMSEAKAAAAAACVGCVVPSSEAIPSGAAGGTPVKVGACPAATVAPKLVKAASKGAAAEGAANAEASELDSAAAALATAVDGGTRPEA